MSQCSDMEWLKLLTEYQKSIGYKQGDINLVGLLGIAGESGEVLEEYLKAFVFDEARHLANIDCFILFAKTMDKLKKRIKKGEATVTSTIKNNFDVDAFDEEIADLLTHLNILIINRGRTLNDYAEIAYQKQTKKAK